MKILIEITLLSGVITPEELKKLIDSIPVPAGGTEGVIISGRLPVWAFAALVHHFHARPWVATFDPRLGGGVVVASHAPGVSIGNIVDIHDQDTKNVSVEFGG